MGHDEVELVRTLATAALNYTRSSDALDAAHNGIPRRGLRERLRHFVDSD